MAQANSSSDIAMNDSREQSRNSPIEVVDLSQSSVEDSLFVPNGETIEERQMKERAGRTQINENLGKQQKKQITQDQLQEEKTEEVFEPLQQLYKTPVELVCGKNLDDSITCHWELLACHSKMLALRFAESKRSRLERAAAVQLKWNLKKVSALLADEKDKGVLLIYMDEAMNLFRLIITRFPIVGRQKSMRADLAAHLSEIYNTKENYSCPSSAAQIRKKLHEQDLVSRLQHLSLQGVHALVSRMLLVFRKVKEQQRLADASNAASAAASNKILLPGFDADCVHGTIFWIYNGGLQFENARALYNILELSQELGITELTAKCLIKIRTAAVSTLSNASQTGIGIRSLLEEPSENFRATNAENRRNGQDPLADIVLAIFERVLSSDSPPPDLENLVVNAIAGTKGAELFNWLEPKISRAIMRKIVLAQCDKVDGLENRSVTALA